MINISQPKQNKKIVFDDDGGVLKTSTTKSVQEPAKKRKSTPGVKKRFNSRPKGFDDDEKKWFQVYPEFNLNLEVTELKDSEINDLNNLCISSFEAELPNLKKKNPSDARWLETALHTGTSKDRANAGALLVTSNPLGNLPTLETLISYCKPSNKASPDVNAVLTELFMEVLLPAHRKLLSIPLRGSDWKAMRKDDSISKEQKQKIFSYWHFESELKDHYFEFLKNLQQSLQGGQDSNKNAAIISASKLLCHAPEKEQMLLSMLINKLGDPSNKVASKALHHLSEVAYKHPNMCGVITNEAEKLLFRNNIAERAQHFALCFLAQIAPNGHSDVCTKLVNICFSFFKVLVKKGAVNNKTMQAILRCLQKAIVDAKPANGSTEIMTKEMQDTIYRLVHLADIRVSIQTLSLLLQVISLKSDKADRFYNALYRKLLDLNLTTIGTNTASQFLHIVHRAIHIDQNVQRAQAFIKRLLQISLYMPAQIACGSLIVINKLLKLRPELDKVDSSVHVSAGEQDLAKFDSDGEEKYEDIVSDDEAGEVAGADKKASQSGISSSWHHAKNVDADNSEVVGKVKEITATKYDPYHRVPAYAGAEFSIKSELCLLKEHFHPTVQVFAENVINQKKINYYGDPLRDFNLTTFLERFAFKNPKKLDENKATTAKTPVQIMYNKAHHTYGSRGKPITALTKTNCTEDELFIFNYLEKKRDTQAVKKKADDDDEDAESVDDDEFEDYLDSLCKKSKDDDDEDFDVDYMKELGVDLKEDKKKKKKKKEAEEDENEDIDNDWGDDDEENISEMEDEEENDEDDIFESDDEGSVSLDDGDDDDDSIDDKEEDSMDENEMSDDEDEPKRKKSKKVSSGKDFAKALKNSDDMSSLFAAADDFAELLEETGNTKGHGTSRAVSNKDKSSEKQLKWEEKRRSGFSKGGFKTKFKKFGKKGK